MYDNPHNLISFSDAGAHLNNMAFYDFPLQMIKRVQESIDKGQPMMSMEKCIWRLTKELADWFNIDAGELKEGSAADLVIIDPTQLQNVSDKVFEAPIEEFDNYVRLVNRSPKTVHSVYVNGELIYENDDFVEGYGKTKKIGAFKPRKVG